jgi:hypothetical protein
MAAVAIDRWQEWYTPSDPIKPQNELKLILVQFYEIYDRVLWNMCFVWMIIILNKQVVSEQKILE